MRIVLIITLCLMPLTAQAAWLQFDPTTGNVTGIDDVPRPAEGRDVVEFPGVTATDFAWPVPSGCAAGEPSWTRVVNRALVEASDLAGLAIRPDVLLFTTTSTLLPGCHRVHGWQ